MGVEELSPDSPDKVYNVHQWRYSAIGVNGTGVCVSMVIELIRKVGGSGNDCSINICAQNNNKSTSELSYESLEPRI